MSSINNMILHRIRVKLYTNNLKNVEGAYIARTDNDKTLDIEDVCTIMKTRGDVTGGVHLPLPERLVSCRIERCFYLILLLKNAITSLLISLVMVCPTPE